MSTNKTTYGAAQTSYNTIHGSITVEAVTIISAKQLNQIHGV
jgi:hypothetical protein